MLSVARWTTLAVWGVWVAIYWRGGIGLVSGLARSTHSSLSRYDTALIVGIVILSNVMLWTGYFMLRGRVADGWGVHGEWLVVLGTLLVGVGCVGTLYCRAQMGSLWSAHTVLLAEHKVIDYGPYAWVRHPIYAFSCTMTLGTVLAFMTWWTVFAGALAVLLYVVKGVVEERTLAAQLPGYREYQHRVRYRLAPWIW